MEAADGAPRELAESQHESLAGVAVCDDLSMESGVKQSIAAFLNDCVDDCVIPELGEAKKGKVRDI